jgi:DUF971 family protein
VQLAGPGGRLLERGDENGLDHRGTLLVELGVDAQRLHLAMTVDDDLDRAASVGDLDALGGELFLHGSDTALHLLRLLEEFADACHGPVTFPACRAESSGGESRLEDGRFGLNPEGVRAPVDIQLVGTFLALRWEDGREDILPGEFLRERSPSAENLGEKDILGNTYGGDGPRQFPGVAVTGMHRVGNYALSLVFSDGHSSGIYSWEYLRRLGDELA